MTARRIRARTYSEEKRFVAVDPYDGSLPPAAVTTAGRRVDVTELEAAAELERSAQRLGLPAVLGGFTIYRLYRRFRSPLRKRLKNPPYH